MHVDWSSSSERSETLNTKLPLFDLITVLKATRELTPRLRNFGFKDMPADRSTMGRGGAARASGSGGNRGRGGRGRGGGGGGRGGRAGRGGRGLFAPYTPYVMPVYPPNKTLFFDGRGTGNWNETLLDTPGIEKIQFGPDFSVNDEHLLAIAARPALGASLKSLSLGDSDTGTGGSITNEGVVALVTACPNLRVLMLDAALNINDATLIACCQACPNLELLRITGHDRCHGSIKGASLKKLKASPEIGPQLKELVLYDQSENGVEALSKARKKLAIKVGDTKGDSMAAGMIDDGSGILFTYVGGKMAGIDMDDFF